MDKEELEKEARINLKRRFGEFFPQLTISYVMGAEPREKRIVDLEKENAELRKVAEFQQSSNMNTHLENKKLKEGLAVGSIFNKALNSMNKSLEEERDRYREMTFDMKDQLTNAKEIISEFVEWANWQGNSKCPSFKSIQDKAEQFLKDSEGKE